MDLGRNIVDASITSISASGGYRFKLVLYCILSIDPECYIEITLPSK